MNFKRRARLAVFLFGLASFSLNVWACMGPETEKAQESDAKVIFVGEPIGYELGRGPLAQVNFKVKENIRGEKRARWTAIMRGSTLPKSLKDFVSRFSSYL